MARDLVVQVKASDLTLLMDAAEQVLGDYSEKPVDWTYKHQLARAIGHASISMDIVYERCSLCDERESGAIAPSHDGNPRCESGSIASGGTRAHCTCDTCF